MGFLGDINAPLAAVAPKSLRPVLHPIGAIRREAGDTAGAIIDPFGAFAESQKKKKPVAREQLVPLVPTTSTGPRRSSLLTGE